MKTIVITGATSFLGRNTMRRLLDDGCDVYAFVRRPEALPDYAGERLHIIEGSLDSVELIKDSVDHADCFIHFAWDGSGYAGRADNDIQLKNVGYSMRALRIAHEIGCRQFIFPGSQSEYGTVRGKITEATPCNPVSPHGRAKLNFSAEAERYCENIDMNFIHLRIFSVYGFGDREGTLVNICVDGFNSGERVVLGPCAQMWNYLYIGDFEKIISRLVKNERAEGIYNVAGCQSKPLREYVRDIYEMSNKSGTYEFGLETQNPEGSPPLEPVTDKIESLTGGIEFTPFKDGIKKMMEYKGYGI